MDRLRAGSGSSTISVHAALPEHVWEGIYEHFDDAPAFGEGFLSEAWVHATRQYTLSVRAACAERRGFPPGPANEESLLPFLVSTITKDGPIRIVEFGGGMGAAFLRLRAGLSSRKSVEHHIIENQKLCAAGAALHRFERSLMFHTEPPDCPAGVDIVYMNSALQYIRDYRKLLARLAAYEPRFFLFVKLSAGRIPTYATSQINVHGSSLPYWFINAEELIEIMEQAGYELMFRSLLERRYDQDHFPATHRLERACNLLFGRAT